MRKEVAIAKNYAYAKHVGLFRKGVRKYSDEHVMSKDRGVHESCLIG